MPVIETLQEKRNDEDEESVLEPIIQTLSEAERKYLETASGMQFEADEPRKVYCSPLYQTEFLGFLQNIRRDETAIPRVSDIYKL